MKKLESTFLNMFLSLTIISLVAGAGLALVKNFTQPKIDEADRKNLEDAIAMVLPEGATVGEVQQVDGKNIYPATDIEGKFCAAIEVETDGFGGKVKMMVGFDAEGTLVDYSILASSETPGLGAKLDTWFKERSDIRGAKIADGEVKVSKDGGNYDAITAATISSRAFMVGINDAMNTYTTVQSTFAGTATETTETEPVAEQPSDSTLVNQTEEAQL